MNKNKIVFTTAIALFFMGVTTFIIYHTPQFARAEQNPIRAIRTTDQELTEAQLLAQDIALENWQVSGLVAANRSEVMGIYTLAPNERPNPDSCTDDSCYRVVIYDFDRNEAVTMFVNLESNTVFHTYHQPNTRPELNNRLLNLAYEIVQNDQDVEDALGFKPERSQIWVMDSSRMDTDCDGSHYCVATVFAIDSGTVWALVDLTDQAMEKVWWNSRLPDPVMNIYHQEPAEDTVRALLDCGEPFTVTQNGWNLNYITTPTDGLEVYDVTFNGQEVATSMKVLEWHAHYPLPSNTGFADYAGCSNESFGYQIKPYGPTQILDLVDNKGTLVGFEVVQDFRMDGWGLYCNYRYEQHFEFYTDGRFRVGTYAYGQGCGNGGNEEAIYRPVVRIDIAIQGDANDSIAAWDGSDWVKITTEEWQLQNDMTTTDGFDYIVKDTLTVNGYYIEQGRGQYDDGGTGDNAYLYVTQYKDNEGASDIGMIGDCCTNPPLRQGPDLYVNDENVDGENIVLWYVPQSTTFTTWHVYNGLADVQYCWTDDVDHTWPCISGPMFVPTPVFHVYLPIIFGPSETYLPMIFKSAVIK